MAKTEYFVALVDKVHDACNEMTATLDALARKEGECNMLFAEVDALKRKVASLESVHNDALELMDQCTEDCNTYIKYADVRTAAAVAQSTNWYSRSVMYDDERRAANAARKALEVELQQCRAREASIFADYEQLLCCYYRDTAVLEYSHHWVREENKQLRQKLNAIKRNVTTLKE